MKKVLACLMAMMLILGICPSLAEAPEEATDLDTLTVGSATAMSGYFFTDLWGRNTADMDVRTLLHGYDLIGTAKRALLTLITRWSRASL